MKSSKSARLTGSRAQRNMGRGRSGSSLRLWDRRVTAQSRIRERTARNTSMRTFSAISSVVLVMAAVAAAPAHAFDASMAQAASEMPPPEAASALTAGGIGNSVADPLPGFMNTTVSDEVPPQLGEKTTASEAFNMARNLYRRGEKTEAMNVLQFAANQGHIGAR